MFKSKNFFIKVLDIVVCTFISTGIIFAAIYLLDIKRSSSTYVMGGLLNELAMDTSEKSAPLNSIVDTNERYFRPSNMPALNVRAFPYKFYSHLYDSKPSPDKVNLPRYLISSPENTILNYFSTLREAENLTKDKPAGCGTVGMSNIPYPAAYQFLSQDYQEALSYEDYLKSFEGIGHLNLIKLKELPKGSLHPDTSTYFIEIEAIEGSSKGNTSFSYYYGFININKEADLYKISSINLTHENYLCAPYHGWQYIAEYSVDIRYGSWCKLVKKRLPTEKTGYIKNIYVLGNDDKSYKFEFFQLTNGMDIEIEQYVKAPTGNWVPIDIDTDKCLKKNFPAAR